MAAYHDGEWGVPVRDDAGLFEMLTLEGAQAGLSWRTILNKREGYRRAFDGFDPRKVARYDARRIAQMMRVGLFKPVHVKTLVAQEQRMLLTSRKLLQRKLLDVESDLVGRHP